MECEEECEFVCHWHVTMWTVPLKCSYDTLNLLIAVTRPKISCDNRTDDISLNCFMRLLFSFVRIEIRCQLLRKPPQSFPVFCSSRPLYVCMLSTPVIIDIQNKDVLIFNWVELSSSAERFSDLPVGSALLPYTLLFPYCRSPFPTVFLYQRSYLLVVLLVMLKQERIWSFQYFVYCFYLQFPFLLLFFSLFVSHQLAFTLPPIIVLLIQIFQ